MLITITTFCPICGKEQFVNVMFDDWMNYQNSDILIQDAFPYLNAEEREAIKTGICGDCWEKMFSF